MKIKLCLLFVILLAGAGAAFAQNGGKAEPLEIKFASGKSSATLSNTLANYSEMEYSFTARNGQKVTLTCNAGFDFRLFQADTDFDTEWNSGKSTFELPADGEYMLFVRKKLSKVKRARFTLTISVK